MVPRRAARLLARSLVDDPTLFDAADQRGRESGSVDPQVRPALRTSIEGVQAGTGIGRARRRTSAPVLQQATAIRRGLHLATRSGPAGRVLYIPLTDPRRQRSILRTVGASRRRRWSLRQSQDKKQSQHRILQS